MGEAKHRGVKIGGWTVQPSRGLLSRSDDEVHLEPRQMDVLLLLADRRGEVVSADEFISEAWKGVTVGDEAVYYCVSKLREALGDDSQNPSYIETISKRGYRLIAPVVSMDAADTAQRGAGPGGISGLTRSPRAIAALGVIGLLIALFIYANLNSYWSDTAADDGPSIAVLPFTDLSPEGNHEYFADGIAEDLLNALAKVPQLRVAGRTSSFTFRDRNEDLRVIGEILGVGHVLEGSVRRDGNEMRITAQLIDAETGFHLWSATYDRELTDIFAVQDEISIAIVAALSESMGFVMAAAPKVPQTANSAAYDAYLLGILEASRRSGASLEAAKLHLERAVALDPDYAPAHARLSITLGLLPQYNSRYTMASVKETWAYHTERAMALAPDTPESLAAKGLFAWLNAVSLQEVRATLERAVELNPSHTAVLFWLANISVTLGDYQTGRDNAVQALRIDPLNPLTVANSAGYLIRTGRFDKVGAMLDRLRTLSPSHYWSQSAQLAEERGLIADAAIYNLEQLAVDRAGMRARINLAGLLAFGLGLADETSGFDHRNWAVLVFIGQVEEALVQAEDFLALGITGPQGQVLLAAGRPGEAVGYLNQAWDQALAIGSVDVLYHRLRPAGLVTVGRARQMTGDRAGGKEALEADLAVVARRRVAEISQAELDWTEGLARYYLGQKETGLRLAARAAERGFVAYMLQPQYQSLTDDPAFAPILAAREAYATAERDKFLTIVCNGGNPAPEVWTPMPETCLGYVEG